MELEELIEQTTNYIFDKIGGEVERIHVQIKEHWAMTDEEGVVYGDDCNIFIVTCYMRTTEITVIKPASKLDMIKAAMPYFIRRVLPPKRTEEVVTIGVPGRCNMLKRQKYGAYCRFTNEMVEDYPNIVEYLGNIAINTIQAQYKYITSSILFKS